MTQNLAVKIPAPKLGKLSIPIPIIKEVWETIKLFNEDDMEFTQNYNVSKAGHVKNTEKDKPISPSERGTQGYLCVQLSHGGKTKTFDIHRLVAETFKPRPEGCTIVTHISHNIHDNSVDNLEWITEAEAARRREQNKKESDTPRTREEIKYAEAPDASAKTPEEYPDYLVTVSGKVYSKRQNGYLLSCMKPTGLSVTLTNQHGSKTVLVSHLVAELHIPKPESTKTLYVFHHNGDKSDNSEANLYWATHKKSTDDKKNMGSSKKVVRIERDGTETEFPNAVIAAEASGCASDVISKCCRGKQKTAGGYQWRNA